MKDSTAGLAVPRTSGEADPSHSVDCIITGLRAVDTVFWYSSICL